MNESETERDREMERWGESTKALVLYVTGFSDMNAEDKTFVCKPIHVSIMWNVTGKLNTYSVFILFEPCLGGKT